MIKPRTPPGIMELLPREQITFQRMLDVIRRNYERFGFLPIETPAFEFSDILLTKSGGETERQVYFVESTGARAQAASADEANASPALALRFDLTVPLARYVAEHQHMLVFPFRRYQLQRVYRGERAQRGRFREFYQCDVDIVGQGSLSVHHDAEVMAVIYSVFSELNIGPFRLELNHRQLLCGWLAHLGVVEPAKQQAVLREIDKLDKRGEEAVRQTLLQSEDLIVAERVDDLLAFVAIRTTTQAQASDQLKLLCVAAADQADVVKGAGELEQIMHLLIAMGVPEQAFCLNLSIARGLDYYTGVVCETQLIDHPHIGSICSGGRYANLANHYTQTQLPGVGVSIGLTRLFWQLREAGLIAPQAESSVQAMVALFDPTDLDDVLSLGRLLRTGGINTFVQMEAKKLARQFQYAARAGIRFVIVAGEQERGRNVVAVKDLLREQQFEIARDELVSALQVELEQAKVMVTAWSSSSSA